MHRLLRLTVCACFALLVACGQGGPAGGASAAAATPKDPKLAKLYGQTCRTCHGMHVSNAPQAGDAAAWQPRLAQGMDVLVQHAINGYKGMPPLGSCSDCTDKDYEALIRFMSGQGG